MNAALAVYQPVLTDFRNGKIDEATFLLAKAEYVKHARAYDEAFAVEAERLGA